MKKNKQKPFEREVKTKGIFHEIVRKIDIDVLSNKKYPRIKKIADNVIKTIRPLTKLRVESNKPWSMESVDGGIFKDFLKRADVNLIGIDVSNRNLKTGRDRRKIAKLITSGIKSALGKKIKSK